MKTSFLLSLFAVSFVVSALNISYAPEIRKDFSPEPGEQQLPNAMHSAMKELPKITVGKNNAHLIGSDNRVLQAAVDYIAGLGGGIVEIKEGEYVMYDSLHLRANVTIRGKKGSPGDSLRRTVLRKADGAISPLALDGDFGEQQITLEDPTGFEVGYGVSIWDDSSGGFHTTVARITGRSGNTFSIDKPLMADCMVSNKAKAATIFPVISGYHIEGARIEDLIIDGNKDSNIHLNGCRGAGIFLYRAFGTVIRGCIVRNYNGDGISFQQSNDVAVVGCISEDNTYLGIHPGSGSQRPRVRNCIARGNGTDGLFLCWRVRHGLFENNILEGNGRFGISIGHKDSDNLFRCNIVRSNHRDGIFFRNETLGMAAHRNCFEENIIENNGKGQEVAGIRIRGHTNNLVFKNNIIRDTRPDKLQRQTVGIRIEEQVGQIILDGNKIKAKIAIDDRRVSKSK
ncbi:MAG: right-handed parallel beta-helix repeat-containing protein [Planctomycetes bacterium]|nr:right-handed parallel beta-helix repeat-containing protein [Planctomycetota bacterium]MCH8119061.1 right-handed parallel beta-helix repeat-containing protein [Planctomycetota bacterium]